MKLSEVKDYVKKNNLEVKYNKSFNMNKINDPKKTFYSAHVVDSFVNSVSNNNDINYINYYKFLSLKFYPNGEGKFIDYLKKLSIDWCNKDNNIIKDESLVYLLKQFVVNPVDGKLKEEAVLLKVKKRFVNFKIKHPTKEEDASQCWDIGFEGSTQFFYFQVKPNSFFNSLSKNSKYSLNKIHKASINYDKPIFLVKEDRNEIKVLIRDKENNKKTCFLPLSSFNIESLNQKQIKELSIKTFDIIDTIEKQKKNNKKRKL